MRAMTREELRVNVLDYFCGCGSPEAACMALVRLLEFHPLYDHREEFETWVSDRGIEYLLLYQLDHMELTEHGGSVAGAWLTPKGVAALAGLKREQEEDEFDTLCESYCIHGVGVDDLTGHDCMAASDPVKWRFDGPPVAA